MPTFIKYNGLGERRSTHGQDGLLFGLPVVLDCTESDDIRVGDKVLLAYQVCSAYLSMLLMISILRINVC